ncbi:MAG: hypothetical protein PHH47_10185 [Gallionella sp.]|nr:hypothetical protein [Gallionella sp.]MDD4946469.1 hypothetical protein [Gallionella sp.]
MARQEKWLAAGQPPAVLIQAIRLAIESAQGATAIAPCLVKFIGIFLPAVLNGFYSHKYKHNARNGKIDIDSFESGYEGGIHCA